jgi:Flp pilus assembly pilin Flp
MIRLVSQLIIEDRGQDLIEYSLLLTFVLFAVIGLFAGFHDSVAGVTSITGSNLDTANRVIH